MQFPFLPKTFTGRRVAKELDYLSQDPGDHDAIPCSVTDFLCYLNRSLSFFRPQSLIWKTQIIALPWRVPCSQVLKKWWWWARIDWSQRQNDVDLYLQQNSYWKKILFAILVKLQPSSSTLQQYCQGSAKASNSPEENSHFTSPSQISTTTCLTFFLLS